MLAPKGYIALLSVLIISSLLLILVADGSIEGVFARDAVNEESSYRESVTNAWSCAYLAFNRLIFDPNRFSHTGTTTITLSPLNTCHVIAASTTDFRAEVYVQGNAGYSFTSFYITAVRDSPSKPYFIDSWEEL